MKWQFKTATMETSNFEKMQSCGGIEIHEKALDMNGIWDRPYYDYCNSLTHVGHY